MFLDVYQNKRVLRNSHHSILRRKNIFHRETITLTKVSKLPNSLISNKTILLLMLVQKSITRLLVFV